MTGRLRKVWLRLEESLWFVPGLMTAFSVVLAFATIRLDLQLLASGRASDLWFVFGVGAEGVRGVLSAIAGSIITVTGVVFSITIVALQLASTQFTPRVLRTFLEDRANHVVLGVFIGTFTYALVILRFVRADSERLTAFVPSVSVTVAMVLAMASIGCLIYFIDHSAHSIRASTIIERLMRDAVATARRAFPAEIGEPAAPASSSEVPAAMPRFVRTEGPGYLQLVDEDALLALSGFGKVTVRMEEQMGTWLRTGDVLASIWTAQPDTEEGLEEQVRAAFVLGPEPTGHQDVGTGISQLVDIAVKALSPGINDPGTAAMCIDSIGEVLSCAGGRGEPPTIRMADAGTVRLIARRPTFDELVVLGFAQIRHYGANAPAIAERLLRTAAGVARRVPANRRGALAREAGHVTRAAIAAIADPDDRARIAALGAAVEKDLA